jgi:hypothetical protein
MTQEERVRVYEALARRLWDERQHYRYLRDLSRAHGQTMQAERQEGAAAAVTLLLLDALADRRKAQGRGPEYLPYTSLAMTVEERYPKKETTW